MQGLVPALVRLSARCMGGARKRRPRRRQSSRQLNKQLKLSNRLRLKRRRSIKPAWTDSSEHSRPAWMRAGIQFSRGTISRQDQYLRCTREKAESVPTHLVCPGGTFHDCLSVLDEAIKLSDDKTDPRVGKNRWMRQSWSAKSRSAQQSLMTARR